MAIVGDTELGATKQDVITSLIQGTLGAKGILAPTVLDVSQYATKGAQSIAFPKRGRFTVENRASAAAGTQQVLTYGKDVLDLNFNAYISYVIDSYDSIQAAINAEVDMAEQAAMDHLLYVDTQILAVAETVGDAVTAGAISKAKILEMRAKLVTQNADLNMTTLVIGAADEATVLAIDGFVEADKYGEAVVQSGILGKLYGVAVKVHPSLAANTFYMWEKRGIALGFQKGAKYDSQKAIEYGTGAELVAIDQLFGVKGLQIGQGGVGVAESALVVKDGN